MIAYAAHIRAWWEDRNPDYAPIAEGQVWASWLTESYLKTRDVSGDPLDFLPPSAIPHIHSAAALRLVLSEALIGKDLDSARVMLDDVLKRRVGQSTALEEVGPIPLNMADMWAEEPREAGELIVIPYINVGRRACSPDPSIDRTVALLEAIGRQQPPNFQLLEAARHHDDPLVRWTVRRLVRAHRNFRRIPPPASEHAPQIERVQPLDI